MTASAANGGGTKITEAFAPVSFTASCTVLKIGHPSWVVPPFPGRDTADDGRAVGRGLLGVKGALATGQSLDHEACRFIDQYGHDEI